MTSTPSRLVAAIRQGLADYSMIFVLLLLMATFSLLTIKPQNPTGASAGVDVANEINSTLTSTGNVVILAPAGLDDVAFADAVETALDTNRLTIVGRVSGFPGDARTLLERLRGQGTEIHAVAVTGTSAQWKVFEKFPELTSDRFFMPSASRWPDFLKLSNLRGVASQTAIYAIIAIGMTMIIIVGGIDLSVGSLVALSSVTATVLIRSAGGSSASAFAVLVGCVAGILVTSAAGFFNGMMITVNRLPSFIVTLGMMLMARGLAEQLADQQSINAVPAVFRSISGDAIPGVPSPIILMIALFIGAHLLMQHTVFGRTLYAIGGNSEAARLCGIRVERYRLAVYTITGALAGLGGVLLSSRLNAGDPRYGEMYELEVIAAVVVGGTSLMGGEGRILGTLIGAFIIAVIRNGMNLLGIESSSQKMVLGAVLLGAVLFDQWKRRFQNTRR